jgi:single-strand DNA-binding protein
MASFNRVVIMGNLGQDPELRYTPNQVAVCTLNIATTDYRTSADGQKVEQTEWHRVVVFNKQAENCQKYLAKGRSVLIEGKLQTRSWEDQKTGQKRYMTEIVAQNVQFVGGSSQSSRERTSVSSSQGLPPYSSPANTGTYSPQNSQTVDSTRRFDMDLSDPGEFGGGSAPMGLEEIPF